MLGTFGQRGENHPKASPVLPRKANAAMRAAAALFIAGVASVIVGLSSLSQPSDAARAVLQHNHNADPKASCGPVSLAVVSWLLGRPQTLEHFNAQTRVGLSGVTSMQDLKQALETSGFSVAGVRLDPTRPPSTKLPMILHVTQRHFLVGSRVGKDGWIVVNPPAPPKVASHSAVRRVWTGNALLVAKESNDLNRALSDLGIAFTNLAQR